MAGGKKNQGNPGNQGGKGPAPVKKEEFKFDFQGQGLSQAAQTELLPVLQKKLGQLVGKSSGYLETLPKSVQIRVGALKHLQAKTDELEAAYRKEVAALDEKYRKLKDPLFNRRTEIVTGSAEPTTEEIANVKTVDNTTEDKDIKGIPTFWLEALKHHPQFGMMITDEDEKVLEHLIDLKVVPVGEEGGPSFSLEFSFASNEFFNESTLSKVYHLKEEKDLNEVVLEKVEASPLTWKEGKNVTVKLVTKQQKVGGKGGRGGKRGGKGGKQQTKTITVEEPVASFFNFFQPPDEDEFEGEEDGEEELQAILEDDYEMGIMIKSMIIPNAVNWYTGEVEIPEDAFPFGEEEDEDEEGDAEEFDSEEEDFDPKKVTQGGQPGQQPECKQQ